MDDPRAVLAREPMHWRQLMAVGLATALNALDGFDVLSISFASPGIAKDWGIDRAALGVVLSMELIGMGVGAFLLGTLADRIGRRPTILSCLLVMAVGMFLASTAATVPALSAFRLLTGLGIGGMLAATTAVTVEVSNARRRNLAVAVMSAGYPLGAVVGGSIATSLLASTGSWRSVFEFGAIATLCFVPLVLLALPETVAYLAHKRPAGALDKINRILKRLGHAQVDELPPPEPAAPRPGLAEVTAPALLNTTVLLIVATFAHMMTFYFFIKWIPKVVVDMGFPPAEAGGVLVWANVGGAIGSLVISLLTTRVGVRTLTMGAMVCGAAAIAAFGQNITDLNTLSLVAAIASFFTNGAIAGLYAVIAQSYPARLRAGATGLVIGVGRAGAATGPVAAGLLFAAGWGLSPVAVTLAGGTLLAAVALAFVRYRENSLA